MTSARLTLQPKFEARKCFRPWSVFFKYLRVIQVRTMATAKKLRIGNDHVETNVVARGAQRLFQPHPFIRQPPAWRTAGSQATMPPRA